MQQLLNYVQYVFQLSQLCPDDEIVLVTASKLIKAVANYQQVGYKSINISDFMKGVNLYHRQCCGLVVKPCDILIPHQWNRGGGYCFGIVHPSVCPNFVSALLLGNY